MSGVKRGVESQTAILVCMARALAHERTRGVEFSDPTALPLLPADKRAQVERLRAESARGETSGFRRAWEHRFHEVRAQMMVVRTVAIDRAVSESGAPQLVILGAGLDGRAFRLAGLEQVTVFEVDHPDSQRQKRARAAALTPVSRDIRFVPVDFTRDRLDEALAQAGHDPSRPTTWVWEGVMMYLRLPEIESTLRVIEGRSAPSSRLVALYHSPSPILGVISLLLRFVGEPLRSNFTPDAMRALLAKHRFAAERDDDLGSLALELSPEFAEAARRIRHNRLAVANRLPP
jgi:methyltransferase (TIGR00027 family)